MLANVYRMDLYCSGQLAVRRQNNLDWELHRLGRIEIVQAGDVLKSLVKDYEICYTLGSTL